MFLIVNKYFFKKRFVGVTLWPFIVMKQSELKDDAIFLNHERIHLRQQIEMGIILFFLWYGLEFLIRLFQYGNAYVAYTNISFEREAYENELFLEYLSRRKLWSFLKYL